MSETKVAAMKKRHIALAALALIGIGGGTAAFAGRVGFPGGDQRSGALRGFGAGGVDCGAGVGDAGSMGE